MYRCFTIFLAITLLVIASCQEASKKALMIGVKIYGHEGDLNSLFEDWEHLGINLALVSPELAARPGFMDMARIADIRVFLILPTFYNEGALRQDLSLLAIKSSGQPAVDDWVRFICPNRMDYRQAHLEYVKGITEELQPDGISIDFIRYFVFWEKVYPGQTYADLPQTCFNDLCLDRFQKDFGIHIPDTCEDVSARADYILLNYQDEWTTFKCQTISKYVQELVQAIEDVKPGTLINFHAVPWRSADFEGAVLRIAGQDLSLISHDVDFISPMCYAHMVKQPPDWVHKVVLDMAEQVPEAILLPSIQVDRAYLDTPLSGNEFRSALAEAMESPSSGVILWSWEALERSSEKMEIFREFVQQAL